MADYESIKKLGMETQDTTTVIITVVVITTITVTTETATITIKSQRMSILLCLL